MIRLCESGTSRLRLWQQKLDWALKTAKAKACSGKWEDIGGKNMVLFSYIDGQSKRVVSVPQRVTATTQKT